MAVDQPLATCPREKDGEKKHSKEEMDAVYDRWAAKKKGRSLVGKKISLGDYLNNKNLNNRR